MMQNWADNTYDQYWQVSKSYTRFHGISFEELLREAEEDEDNIRKVNKRRIKKRLTQYMLHLHEEKRSNSTIQHHITKLKHIYRYQDIEIPSLPRITKQEKESYTDLLTREEITRAIQNSNTKMKAVITFLASSGLRRSDMAQLTVQDFLKATTTYHHREIHDITEHDLHQLLQILSGKQDMIPFFEIVSQKTGVVHFTFCSPEASSFVVQMLRERYMRKGLSLDESLFGIREKSVTANFERLSDKLCFEWKNRRRRFHPHGLRSWFATTLQNNDVDFLAVEFLLGHTLKSTTSSYYYANPEKIRLKYERVVDELCFVSSVSRVDLVSDEHRELSRLRDENRDIRDRLYELEELIDMLRSA